jgi:DNA gyrase subunit A
MDKYPLSVRQADAILEMRLYQLTGLEREKIEKEYMELLALIQDLTDILENEGRLLSVIKEELGDMRAKYASPRGTQVLPAEGEFRMEDLIVNEGCCIALTHRGFIKRTPVSSFRSQRRGGKGVIGASAHEEDYIERFFTASTHDYMMFFMNNGRVYVEKVFDIPEGSRISKGRSVANVLQLQKDESIASMIPVKSFDESLHLVMATRKGIVKKTNLSAYKNFRRGGIIGINIDEGDSLIGVKLTHGADDICMITRKGMSIRFKETDLRDQGRPTRGVKGISLKGKDDYVVTVEVVDNSATLLIAGQNGQGKRTKFEEYRLQKRGGSGIIAMRTTGVAGALSVHEDDEIMLLTNGGQAVRTRVNEVRVIGRTTQGVRLIGMKENAHLIGLNKIIEVDEDDA